MKILGPTFVRSLPDKPPSSFVDWAEAYVRLPGSARSERFDGSITPWTRAIIETAADGITRTCTFVKPVQAGGSVAGEVILCAVLATQHAGDVQYNWEDDQKALERYDKRIDRILRACPPIMRRWPTDRHKAKRGLVMFPHCNLTVQGVFTADNLDSDSIRFQINEEIHNWETGRLEKAYRRTTAFWNSYIINISNAGVLGDQLHQAFQAGTQQHWEVLCPGCGQHHVMRIAWDEKKPKLGGLRYDSKKARRADRTYDYNKLAGTIRYQMPCGAVVQDTPGERRALSLGGRYSEPCNTGAHLRDRSYTLESVAVDYISWLGLIQEKHLALRTLRYGDPEPYKRYLQERECKFWNPEDRPLAGAIILNTALKKDRAGLQGRYARYFALDRQQGGRGEFPHWWLVIRDYMANGDSLLVFEAKVPTEENVIDILDRHECIRRHGCADSGDDTTFVYEFCLRHGINAIKGSKEPWFSHGDEGRKIFSPEKPLWQMLNLAGPTRENPLDEPLFWHYSKVGTLDRLAWLRAPADAAHTEASIFHKPKFEIPGDVSDDYKSHMEAWELKIKRDTSGSPQQVWEQTRLRDDLLKCETYVAMLAEMGGCLGGQTSLE